MRGMLQVAAPQRHHAIDGTFDAANLAVLRLDPPGHRGHRAAGLAEHAGDAIEHRFGAARRGRALAHRGAGFGQDRAHVARCRCGPFGQAADLGGDHRKAAPGIAGMRRFDAGVDRQDIGLERHRVDDFDDLACTRRATFHLVHGLAQRMCGSDALTCAFVGAGGQRNHLRQIGVDVLQARSKALHRGARAIQRVGLCLRLTHHLVVFGHQRRHFGSDLHRQRHCLADRFGQIAEAGLQPAPHVGLRQTGRQQQLQLAAGQCLGGAFEYGAVFMLGLQARHQWLQQRRDRHRPAVFGQAGGFAQQDRGFHMRQRQHPATVLAVAHIAHAPGRVVAGAAHTPSSPARSAALNPHTTDTGAPCSSLAVLPRTSRPARLQATTQASADSRSSATGASGSSAACVCDGGPGWCIELMGVPNPSPSLAARRSCN